MGFTYQKLKRITKNSVVLEKEENIEIQQNSTEFVRKKSTSIRERFSGGPPKGPGSSEHENGTIKQKFSKENVGIAKDLKRSFVLEKDRQENFKQKLHDTHCVLDNLKQNINHEIDKWQKESQLYLKKHKKMEKKKNKNKYENDKCRSETWAQLLAGNSHQTSESLDLLKRIKEIYSSGDHYSGTPPRNGDDNNLATRSPKPRMYSVGSQTKTRKEHFDQAAGRPQCDFSLHTKEAADGGVLCHHNSQQSGVNVPREYSFCQDEYYYDCVNFPSNSQYTRCYKDESATLSHNNKKQDTGHYIQCSRHGDGSCSTESCFDKKSKRRTTDHTSRRKKCDEGEKRNYKKNEEQTHQHQIDKSKRRNQSSTKADKYYKVLNGEDALIFVKMSDHYIDARSAVDLKVYGSTQISGSSSIADKVRSKTKPHEVREEVVHKTTEELMRSCDNSSLATKYSSKTVHMLKKMKIREYTPLKPKEKVQNYKKYVEKYAKDKEIKNPLKILEKKDGEALEFLKHPTQVARREEFEVARDTSYFYGQDGPVIAGNSGTRNETNQEVAPLFQGNQSYEELRFRYDGSKRVLPDWNDVDEVEEQLTQEKTDFYRGVSDIELIKDYKDFENDAVRGSRNLKETIYYAGKSSHSFDQRQQSTVPQGNSRYDYKTTNRLDKSEHLYEPFGEYSLNESPGQYEAEILPNPIQRYIPLKNKSTYTLEEKITQGTQYDDPESFGDNSVSQFLQHVKEPDSLNLLPKTDIKQNSELSLSIESDKQKLESLIVLKGLQSEEFNTQLNTNEKLEPEDIHKELSASEFFEKEADSLLSTASNKYELESPVVVKEINPELTTNELFEKEADHNYSTTNSNQEMENLVAIRDIQSEDLHKELVRTEFFEKEEGAFLSIDGKSQKFESAVTMNEKQPVDFHKELAANKSFEKEELAMNKLFEEESHKSHSQINFQYCQESEINRKYQNYKENPNSLRHPPELSNVQSVNYELTHEKKHEEDLHIYKDLPNSSRETILDPDSLPLRGILKSSCVIENNVVCCEVAGFTSVTSLEKIGPAQQYKEDFKTIRTKDKFVRPITKQSNVKFTETTAIKEPICRDCQRESRFFCNPEMPAFKQCPCMWDTYVQMMTNYYKGKH